MCWLCIVILACVWPICAQEEFQRSSPDYVPEGRAHRRGSIATVEQCQAACAQDSQCKAFAFRTARPSCYFYTRVYMGGTKETRKMGIQSSGLSLVPKRGFVSAFKSSSFPQRITFMR